MLYLVATPIGNLEDITLRAITVLKTVDYILCEDTRHSKNLLEHYQIKKSLQSFHKFNEAKLENKIIEDLKLGKHIALVSDAGSPGIADPGEKLVKRCAAEGITVQAIPGPCAAIAAITISGFETTKFQFVSFLPKKKGELKKTVQDILRYQGTTICYVSSHQFLDAIETLAQIEPTKTICICRELTKKFEEVFRSTAIETLDYWKDTDIKGEFVLVISATTQTDKNWEKFSPEEHVSHLEKTYQLTHKEAIKMAAEIRGVPKREIYNILQKGQKP